MVVSPRQGAPARLAALVLSTCLVLAWSPVAAAGPQIMATATVASYRVVLMIGANEPMYTLADYRAHHYKTGEIILKGMMPPMMKMAPGGMLVPHHLEVHIYNTRTGAVVSSASVAITLTDMRTKKSIMVAPLLMQGIGAGKQDLHYGNMVLLMTEHYVVDVWINGHHVRYAVNWHEAGQGMTM
jgi:hypothetical protein